MAELQPLRALRYDLAAVGSLDAVAAPPYDVVDEAMRADLAARSPFNVVHVDLPRADSGGDPYLRAQATLEVWRKEGVLVRDREPGLWAMEQDYVGPDGRDATRRGFFGRVRAEEYGAGRIRPHERTQPGPKEDRLRLMRATRANLSPIFSLFDDPGAAGWGALEPATRAEPFAQVAVADGTRCRLWRVGDPEAIAAVQRALAPVELLIADGHHRYETARAYADEVGGEGGHRYVLMFLCALADPGLLVLPTHRLLDGLDDARRGALRAAIERDFVVEQVDHEEIVPPPDAAGVAFGYLDAFHRSPLRLELKDEAVADWALAAKPPPYRRVEAAVLEQLVLRGALGMTEEDIARRRGLGYSSSLADAREAVLNGRAEAAFFLRATPLEQVRDVAAAGEAMPPKSTYFYPKVPTGLLFSPLD